MKLDFNCIMCNINQVIKIMDLADIKRDKREDLMREVLLYLSSIDYSKCNPEVIGGTWQIILKYIQGENPYSDIKRFYNTEVLKMNDDIQALISQSENPFKTALKVAITGNLIDFAAKHKFDFEMLENRIMSIEDLDLAIDHSEALYKKLETAKNLMYLGDNCGEICLDKLFIATIKKEFPQLTIYFGVRGEEIVNDVNLDDAKMVGMEEVAEIIDNGDGSLGTVMSRVSEEFKDKFYNADVVIAKGQGNYESLSEIDRDSVFHLFMAKCDLVAKPLGVETLSTVCVENNI